MDTKFQLTPSQASAFAQDMDALFYFLTAVTLFFTFLIAAVIIFFVIRYRRRSQTDRPAEIHGSLPLELLWSGIPFVLAMVMFFWGAHLYFKYAKAPADAIEILVTGKQWMWKIQHPNGKREINSIHVPLGQPVRLTITSEDVIHSFYIPAFRTKMDAVPGRYTSSWFTPTKTGTFHLFCAEYCGTEHSLMVGSVKVLEAREYEAWLSGGALTALSPAEAGQKLFNELGCVTCHGGQPGALGPALGGVFNHEVTLTTGETVVADENYIRESILNPNAKTVQGYQPVMPTYQGVVNETQLMNLVEYIKSIGGSK